MHLTCKWSYYKVLNLCICLNIFCWLTPEAKHRDIKAGLFSLTGGPASVTQPDKRTRRNVIPTNQPFSFHRHSWSHPFPKLENFDQVNFSKVLWGFKWIQSMEVIFCARCVMFVLMLFCLCFIIICNVSYYVLLYVFVFVLMYLCITCISCKTFALLHRLNIV